jgi:hypothetical protein
MEEEQSSQRGEPKILVFNFDENCEDVITNFSIMRFISKNEKNKKTKQEEYINEIIKIIEETKAAVVVICTNNSKSSVKGNHYQHILKEKIKEIKKGLEYAPLLKSDTTLQKNVLLLKMFSKNLCGIRTRIYVDKTQLFFLDEGASKNSFTDRTSLRDERFFTLPLTQVNTTIPSIIKYGYRRITVEEEREKGYGGIMTIFEIRFINGMKKEYIFCNYHEIERENKNRLLKNIFKQNNIVRNQSKDKDIYAYLINGSIVKNTYKQKYTRKTS